MRERGRRMGKASAVTLAMALGACATLGKLYFQDPQIQLQEINVTSLGLSGGTMDLVFDVYTPTTIVSARRGSRWGWTWRAPTSATRTWSGRWICRPRITAAWWCRCASE